MRSRMLAAGAVREDEKEKSQGGRDEMFHGRNGIYREKPASIKTF
jgi:hypothetical protein